MADRSVIAQGLQIGKEVSAGAGGSANKRLANMMINLSPQMDYNEYRGTGQKYINSVVPGDEWSSGDASGPMGFGEIVYPLSSVIKAVTPTGDMTDGYVWVFDSNATGPDVIATYTVEKGDGGSNFKYNYVYWNDLTLTANRKEATHSGTLQSQQLIPGVTLTATPTNVENVIVVPQKFNMYYASTFAGLTSAPTQIMRAFNWEFTLGSRFAPFFPMNSSNTSFVGIVEQPVDAGLSIRLGMDTSGSDFVQPMTLTKMRAGSTSYIRLKADGPVLGAAAYNLTVDCSAQVNAPMTFEDENGLILTGWSMRIVNDGASGAKPFQISVTNKTATL